LADFDLYLFVNGIPVATAELKNSLTRQTAEHARSHHRIDRDPATVALGRRAGPIEGSASPGLMILRVAPDDSPFEFKPGQYAVLSLKATEQRIFEADVDGPVVVIGSGYDGMPEGSSAVEAQAAAAAADAGDPDRLIRRSYCIVSNRRADAYLEFYVTLILSGELTPRLFNLKVSDRLHVGPKG
jgi:hypothetical protein